MILFAGLLIVAMAVYAVLRKMDVRLVLLVAAFALGVLTGQPASIIQKFFSTLTASQYVVPLCSAMGFAYVLQHTACDQHLVQLLVKPLRRARLFLIPGAVLVGFVVNIPIISQTSSAVAIGSVVIPLLLAAKISPLTAGAALLLGASIGGELLNPGAPEYRTVIREMAVLGIPAPAGSDLVRHTLPFDLLHLAVAVSVFWLLSLRAEAAHAEAERRAETTAQLEAIDPGFKVNLFKAAVPLLPLVLLFLVAPPLQLLAVPQDWLVGAKEVTAGGQSPYEARLIGAAMLVGIFAAALTDRRTAPGVMAAFFDGAGYALTHIVSIIVAAVCFGEGVRLIGLHVLVGQAVTAWPQLLIPAAGVLPLAFGFVAGSGIASTQSLYAFFAEPALALNIAPEHVGTVVSLGAAAGRTMSPVAAVTLMCASLTKTTPAALVKRVAPPLLVGMVVVLVAASLVGKEGSRPAEPVETAPAIRQDVRAN